MGRSVTILPFGLTPVQFFIFELVVQDCWWVEEFLYFLLPPEIDSVLNIVAVVSFFEIGNIDHLRTFLISRYIVGGMAWLYLVLRGMGYCDAFLLGWKGVVGFCFLGGGWLLGVLVDVVDVFVDVVAAFVDLCQFEFQVLVYGFVAGEELVQSGNRLLVIITVTHN